MRKSAAGLPAESAGRRREGREQRAEARASPAWLARGTSAAHPAAAAAGAHMERAKATRVWLEAPWYTVVPLTPSGAPPPWQSCCAMKAARGGMGCRRGGGMKDMEGRRCSGGWQRRQRPAMPAPDAKRPPARADFNGDHRQQEADVEDRNLRRAGAVGAWHRGRQRCERMQRPQALLWQAAAWARPSMPAARPPRGAPCPKACASG